MLRGVKAFVVLLLMASLVLSACGSKPATVAPKADATAAPKGPTGSFVMANVQDAKILDPILSSDLYSSYINGFLYDALITVDDKGIIKPSLARAWEVSSDSLTLTFHLRTDVLWHDGQPFTAKDVVFTYGQILHPGYSGVRRSDLSQIKGVAELDEALKPLDKKAPDYEQKAIPLWENFMRTGGIQMPDANTVTITTAKVFSPAMLSIAGKLIIAEHVYKDCQGSKMKDCAANEKPIGTGMYRFVDWKKGDAITLDANTEYKWGLFDGHAPKIKKFVFKVVPDDNAGMAALENGEVDLALINPDNWDRFTKMPKIQTYEYLRYSYSYFGYNLQKEPFTDPHVRQALTMALDREAIVRDFLKGHGQVANTHGSPVRWDYTDDVKKWPFDVNQAKKLLDDAGWKDGPGGIRVKDGKPLSFTLTYSAGSKQTEQIVALTQQSWKAIGVDLKLEGIKFETLLDKHDKEQTDIVSLGWSLGNEADSYSIWHSKGSFQAGEHFANAAVDAALEAGRLTYNADERKKQYAIVAKTLAEEQPYTFLYYSTSLVGTSKRIKGPAPNAPGGIFWNYTEWTAED